MTLAVHHQYSFAEYVELEETSSVKHEYFGGEIYAIAGGTPEHAALAVAVSTALSNQLVGGRCRVFSSDLRVQVADTGLTTYPDVTVVCGALERDAESRTSVTNPTVVVEVTSNGTEAYDRSEKLEHYAKIPSLRACVLVSHREPRIDVFERAEGGAFVQRVALAGGEASLECLASRLVVNDVYGDLLAGL